MYIFFHIPKTAGSSIRYALDGWFSKHLSDNALSVLDRKNLDASDDDLCVSGHIGGSVVRTGYESLLSRYPYIIANPLCKVFTFLRDPAEQAVSFYLHQRRKGLVEINFDTWIFIRHRFCYRKVFHGSNIDDILKSFFFIGTADNAQKSMDHLSELLSRPKIELPTLNTRSSKDNDISLSSSQRKWMERLYEWEFELYEKCRDHLVNPSLHRAYTSNSQFADYKDSLPVDVTPPRLNSGFENSPDFASLVEVFLHNKAGDTKSYFSPDEAIGVTLVFDIESMRLPVQPTLAIGSLSGEVVFVVAFVDSSGGNTSFGIGRTTTTAWIPANLLNSRRYTLNATLSDPYSKTRLAEMAAPLVFEVLEEPCPARGAWASPFPGVIRPLIVWDKL